MMADASVVSDAGSVMDFFYLIPIAIALGVTGLGAFIWSLRNGQYDDLEGAAARLLLEDEDGPGRDPSAAG